MAKLAVVERSTERNGVATELESGRYEISFGDGDVRELAASTFKRTFIVKGEVGNIAEEPVKAASTEQPLGDVDPANVIVDAEEKVEESVPAEVIESPTLDEEKTEQTSTDLDGLLADAQEVTDSVDDNLPAPTPAPESRPVDQLGLNIQLLDWVMSGTRGGRTDKVTSQISIKGHLMEITEYDGYITDVRVFTELEDFPENDPDARWELVYKSPKMSLKDTLEWFGLSDADMKTARKEITAIRKAVKAAHMESSATA